MGRPGVNRVHRRHGHRRGARPQRPAAVALLRDQRRPGRHGVGGRRARHSGRRHRPQGTPAPGPHLPRRHGARDASCRTKRSSASWRPAPPYGSWLQNTSSTSRICRSGAVPAAAKPRDRARSVSRLFGYTHEDLRLLLAPMATSGEEAIGSMGTDTSLASLSDRPRLLYDYFKQVLRAGHQSAARCDSRGAGDVDGIDGRA